MGAAAERLIFKKTDSPAAPAGYIASAIKAKLAAGRPVLWLVAGGSAMDAAVQAADLLRGVAGIDKLTVTLTDERFGPPGHPDSNWRQLLEKGFGLPGAALRPVLAGKSFDETLRDYSGLLASQLDGAYSLALAGMGPDGHIFGIMPGSPAINSDQPVAGYEWDDYRRLTPTFESLKKLDEVVVYAMGEQKWPQIAKLESDIAPGDQPAQYLKQLERVIFFNDYEGEPA